MCKSLITNVLNTFGGGKRTALFYAVFYAAERIGAIFY